MKQEAIKNSFNLFDVMYGYYDYNNHTGQKFRQSTGSVYGVWLDNPTSNDLTNIINALPNKNQYNVNKAYCSITYNSKNYYPLYWGKDSKVGAQPIAHYKKIRGNKFN